MIFSPGLQREGRAQCEGGQGPPTMGDPALGEENCSSHSTSSQSLHRGRSRNTRSLRAQGQTGPVREQLSLKPGVQEISGTTSRQTAAALDGRFVPRAWELGELAQ